ncbi:hypothetical protein QZH46_15620 [Pseudomonas corrugata]
MTMNPLKNLIPALIMGTTMVAHTMAATEVTVEITNNTRGTLNMTNLLTDPAQDADFPLSAHDVLPKSTYILRVAHQRNYTYPTSGWQPTLKKSNLSNSFSTTK